MHSKDYYLLLVLERINIYFSKPSRLLGNLMLMQ